MHEVVDVVDVIFVSTDENDEIRMGMSRPTSNAEESGVSWKIWQNGITLLILHFFLKSLIVWCDFFEMLSEWIGDTIAIIVE